MLIVTKEEATACCKKEEKRLGGRDESEKMLRYRWGIDKERRIRNLSRVEDDDFPSSDILYTILKIPFTLANLFTLFFLLSSFLLLLSWKEVVVVG